MMRRSALAVILTVIVLCVAAAPVSAATIGNRKTKVFHNTQKEHCKMIVGRLNSAIKKRFNSRIKAIAANYRPCPKCKPIAWVTVKTLSGQSDKASDLFDLLGSKAKLLWSVEGDLYPIAYIYVMPSDKFLDVDGGFPETMVNSAGTGETFLHKPAGSYYLDVMAANSTWSVSVIEAR